MAKPRDRQLLALLRQHDLTAERGTKHWKIRTSDGRMIGTWPFGGRSHAYGAKRAHENLEAQIRRSVR